MKENKKVKDVMENEMPQMVENAQVSPMQYMPHMAQPIMCCPYLMNMQCPMVQGQYMGYNMSYNQAMPYGYNNMNMYPGQTMPYGFDNYNSGAFPYMNNTGVMGQYMDNMPY
ncbi:MAG TPA: hypothetical protein GXX49_03640 [Clostridiaceae bacterium]|jgi:hypothetical protein|nr:hypothetical protein [Clostridiaceae bacterium]